MVTILSIGFCDLSAEVVIIISRSHWGLGGLWNYAKVTQVSTITTSDTTYSINCTGTGSSQCAVYSTVPPEISGELNTAQAGFINMSILPSLDVTISNSAANEGDEEYHQTISIDGAVVHYYYTVHWELSEDNTLSLEIKIN